MRKCKYYIIDMQQYDDFFQKKLSTSFAIKIFSLEHGNNLIMKMKNLKPNCWGMFRDGLY